MKEETRDALIIVIFLLLVVIGVGSFLFLFINRIDEVDLNGNYACQKIGYETFQNHGFGKLCIKDGVAIRVEGTCGVNRDSCAFIKIGAYP